GEERDQLAARELARHNDLALRIDRMNLKHPLRQIETNSRDSSQIPDRLAHGRLPFSWVDDNDHLGTLMPFGAPSTPSLRIAALSLIDEGAQRRRRADGEAAVAGFDEGARSEPMQHRADRIA